MEYMPDPRVVKEDAHDAEAYEREQKERAERAEEQRLVRQAQLLAKKEEQAKKREAMIAEREKKKEGGEDGEEDSEEDMSGSERSGSGSKSGVSGTKSSQRKSKSGGGSLGPSASKGGKSFAASDEDGSDDQLPEDAEDDEEYDGGIGDLPSQPAMKRELVQAIEDERREYLELKKINEECQRKIILMEHNKTDTDKQTDQMLNEHKYLNTLANVHQVRYNLKETQDRYNRMAGEL